MRYLSEAIIPNEKSEKGSSKIVLRLDEGIWRAEFVGWGVEGLFEFDPKDEKKLMSISDKKGFELSGPYLHEY